MIFIFLTLHFQLLVFWDVWELSVSEAVSSSKLGISNGERVWKRERLKKKKKKQKLITYNDIDFKLTFGPLHYSLLSLPLLLNTPIIPCRGVRFFTPPQKRRGVQDITLNCILWWGSSSGDLRRWSTPPLPLLPNLLWPRVAVSIRLQSMGQIDLFKNYLYLTGILKFI